MNPAIRVENLSKCYQIGSRPNGAYRTLRESLTDAAAAPWRRLRELSRWGTVGGGRGGEAGPDHIWALKDVSFEVQPGEVVGIIGRNGAGKSTLLKILSRITEPTTGRAEFRGRIGSLLEVGTGFHPELTGRENIYLNGTILGMGRREIERKFDEIVAFSEIEKFLDTPVKRYSSGMYVRLAFAVAAHLEPEILIVDEVLAVGDATFQKKCLGKLETVAREGRTVLFVSHQMGAIQRLCNRAILLDRGRLNLSGEKDDVIRRYLEESGQAITNNTWIDLDNRRRHQPKAQPHFVSVKCHCPDPLAANHPYPDGPYEVDLRILSNRPQRISSLAVTFYDRYGTKLVNADTISGERTVLLETGINTLRFEICSLHLNPGIYRLGLWMAHDHVVYDHLPDALNVEIVELPENSFGKRPSHDGLVTSQFHLLSLEPC